MSYLLDTNICIHLFRGQFDVEHKISQVGISACYLYEITFAELLYGVDNSAPNRRNKNRENLAWLATAFAGRLLPIEPAKRIGRF